MQIKPIRSTRCFPVRATSVLTGIFPATFPGILSGIFFGTLFGTLFGTFASGAAAPPLLQKPASPAAAPLAGVKLVDASSLSQAGRIMTPRPDCQVPQLMVDLLKDETIVRIYPWCSFAVVAGRPVWTWNTWNNSGVEETSAEALRARLVNRLAALGFEPLPGTPDAIPRVQRGGDRPFKYRRTAPGREIDVEFGGLSSWTGGRKPAVGIDLVLTVRGTQPAPVIKLSDVVAAIPSMAVPGRGEPKIPPAIVESLQSLPVSSVRLAGPGTTWYSLTVVTPAASLTKFDLLETLTKALEAAQFKADELRDNSREQKSEPLLHYSSRALGGTSNCRIRMDKSEADCRISLFVQL